MQPFARVHRNKYSNVRKQLHKQVGVKYETLQFIFYASKLLKLEINQFCKSLINR
jgi:hypothetical protein